MLLDLFKDKSRQLAVRTDLQQHRPLIDEARASAMKVSLHEALAEHAMDQVMALDMHRQFLMRRVENPVLDICMSEIEIAAIHAIQHEQRHLFRPLGSSSC